MHQYDLAHRRLTPDFSLLICFWRGGMNYVSCDICVYHLSLAYLCFSLGYSFSSTVTGACPVTTGLIMRANVRTTTTTQ